MNWCKECVMVREQRFKTETKGLPALSHFRLDAAWQLI